MIPTITPVSDADIRPFWSVLIPTFEPDLRLLDLTVQSILVQDPGGGKMQVEIVDDCSGGFDPHEYAANIAGGRVECFRHPASVGMTRNWNSCISRARGRWIHILHQDDLVHPGFYERMEHGINTEPSIGAAACEHYMIDGEGRERFKVARVDAFEAGILTSWRRHFFERLSFMTPSIVVSRAVYEELGGFDDEFSYAADWDMWKRVAAHFPVWYEPRPLASYRRHGAAATMSLRESGRSMREIRTSIDRSEAYLEPGAGRAAAEAARHHYTRFALRVGLRLMREGKWGGALQHIEEARRMTGWRGVGSCTWRLSIEYIRRRSGAGENTTHSRSEEGKHSRAEEDSKRSRTEDNIHHSRSGEAERHSRTEEGKRNSRTEVRQPGATEDRHSRTEEDERDSHTQYDSRHSRTDEHNGRSPTAEDRDGHAPGKTKDILTPRRS